MTSRKPSKTRSATRAALLVAGGATVGPAGFARHLIVTERRRHEVVEEELTAQSSFLESLVESMGRIAAAHDPDAVLDRTRREANGLFAATASLFSPRQPRMT